MNKKVLIGVGVLAVAGVAFYLWKKNQEVPENKSNAGGKKKKSTSTTSDGGVIVSDLMFTGIRQKSHRNSSATGTTGEVMSELNLEKSKNYRDDIKEIEPVNYYPVNKGYYQYENTHNVTGRRVIRVINV